MTVINWGNAAGAAAAACQLGLTTQVPATVEVAAPGKVPEPVPGVRFTARPFIRRERELSPTEVAVLEVLREPLLAEASLEEVGRRIPEARRRWPGPSTAHRILLGRRAQLAGTPPLGRYGRAVVTDRLIEDPRA